MKLKEINSYTHPQRRITGRSTMNIDKKRGILALSKAATEKIGLQAGNKVVFQISADGDIYITKTHGTEGFILRSTNSKCLMFNNIGLAQELLPPSPTAIKAKFTIGEGTEIAGRMCYPLLNMQVKQ